VLEGERVIQLLIGPSAFACNGIRDLGHRGVLVEIDDAGEATRLNTRYISSRALAGCVKFLNAALHTIASKESAANGMRQRPLAEFHVGPFLRALSLAMRTKLSLISKPTIE